MRTENQQTELSVLVEHAAQDDEAQIQRTGRNVVHFEPADKLHSPLDIAGMDLPISTQEIIELIREGREPTSLTINSQ